MLLAVALLAAIQVVFTYTPLLNGWFGAAGIDLAAWLGIPACAAAIFVLVELEKAVIRCAAAPAPAV
ncbi:MAG: cation transporting ATPase C-terminal domain-containing protein [Betaproteobacteria bacterium]|nr:cation transporting ATPase C-terminal domain-containing protein [Betaproteobacteria bacterium]